MNAPARVLSPAADPVVTRIVLVEGDREPLLPWLATADTLADYLHVPRNHPLRLTLETARRPYDGTLTEDATAALIVWAQAFEAILRDELGPAPPRGQPRACHHALTGLLAATTLAGGLRGAAVPHGQWPAVRAVVAALEGVWRDLAAHLRELASVPLDVPCVGVWQVSDHAADRWRERHDPGCSPLAARRLLAEAASGAFPLGSRADGSQTCAHPELPFARFVAGHGFDGRRSLVTVLRTGPGREE